MIGQVVLGLAVAVLPELGFGADPGVPDEEPPPATPVETADAAEVAPEDQAPVDGEVVDAPVEEDAAPSAVEPVRRGFGVQLGLGISDCFSVFCSEGDGGVVENTRIGLGLDLAAWYRPAPIFSLGVALHGNFFGMRDVPGLETNATWISAEAAARVYPIQTGIVDAFGGLGIGYLRVSATTSDDFASTDSTWQAWFVSVQGGAEVYVMPNLSVGGLLKLDVPFWLNVCSDDSGANECFDMNDLANEDTFPKLFWFLGASATYHFGG